MLNIVRKSVIKALILCICFLLGQRDILVLTNKGYFSIEHIYCLKMIEDSCVKAPKRTPISGEWNGQMSAKAGD